MAKETRSAGSGGIRLSMAAIARTRRAAWSATVTTNPTAVRRPNGTRTAIPGVTWPCQGSGMANVNTRSPARSGTWRATSANAGRDTSAGVRGASIEKDNETGWSGLVLPSTNAAVFRGCALPRLENGANLVDDGLRFGHAADGFLSGGQPADDGTRDVDAAPA